MVGGFLGAGKTTALLRMARDFTGRGLRVGLIANDQSVGLVDTALFRRTGLPTEEIAGGCFCCRFDSLLAAADNLTRASRPDVFLAEPVGSCTDLVATVSYPLRRIYGDRFSIAPLSVLVDPHRAARILGLAEGRPFSAKVAYVYRKQLEEADLLVVNKCDAITEEARDGLVAELARVNPDAEIFCGSARSGQGFDAWFQRVLDAEPGAGRPLDIDYDAYAEGEAALGWLNATLRMTAGSELDGNDLLLDLARALRSGIAGEIAHLKMTLDPGDVAGALGVVSLTRSDDEPEPRETLVDEIRGGSLVVNLRAEEAPEALEAHLRSTLSEMARKGRDGLSLSIEHIESFRPARPEPIHRLASAMASEGAEPRTERP
jgi:G3E family GTPase